MESDIGPMAFPVFCSVTGRVKTGLGITSSTVQNPKASSLFTVLALESKLLEELLEIMDVGLID